MAIINTEFEFNNPRPNFKRDQYNTVEDLRRVELYMVDRGHLSFCLENGRRYEFANDVDDKGEPIYDEVTGYWREYKVHKNVRPTVILQTRQWEDIKNDPEKFELFCQRYDGYDLDVEEDHITGSGKFGMKFGMKFGKS